MGKYFIRRLLGLIPLFIAVVIISFFLMQFAPGGPEQAMKESKKLTNAQIERWLNAWCLEGEDSIVATAKEFGGWSGILNCNNDGSNAFFSEQGGLNFLPRTLGGGDNGLLHGDLGGASPTAARSSRSSRSGYRRRSCWPARRCSLGQFGHRDRGDRGRQRHYACSTRR